MHDVPRDDWKGFKSHMGQDALSGFLVFLLALPLSMGIAAASDFPPAYGLITAMVGGMLVSFLAGSQLTIKGPAAGLVVIVAGAVAEFGGGVQGWHYALAAIALAGVLQVLFGIFKFGKFSEFFPLSAVHGMLAAVGLIILTKQVHGIFGAIPVRGWIDADASTDVASKPLIEPFELIEALPHTLQHIDPQALIIGAVSLLIVFGWPLLPFIFTKRIPAALIVLLVSIPLAHSLALPSTLFVQFNESLGDMLSIHASAEAFGLPWVMVKYVLMFALVGSLEVLITIKAIDLLDPWKRKANADRDLMAVGVGNIVSGLLGGLPMICEVARSSANVHNGGRTRWANFFHGTFVFLFLLFAGNFTGLIPKPALAAMLIGVGFQLAHPKEFLHMWKVGREQFAILLGTIIVSLATDLLLGILSGILIKWLFQLSYGAKAGELFKADIMVNDLGDRIELVTTSSLIFSNYLKMDALLRGLSQQKHVVIDLKQAHLVDHSVLENLHRFMEDYRRNGGKIELRGLEDHHAMSDYPLAMRRKRRV